MKILLFTYKFYPDIGGIESISEMLAQEFMSNGHIVHVVTSTINTEFDNKFQYKIIRNPSITTLFKEIVWADIILENNPCLRMSWLNFFIRKPSVIGLQTWLYHNNNFFNINNILRRVQILFAKYIIACSNAIKNDTYKHAVVIENPYDSNIFKIMPEIDRSLEYVFLGRLVPDKGAKQVIDAFNKLIKEDDTKTYINSTLTIIGEGPDYDRLKLLTKNYNIRDKVNFLGKLKGKQLAQELNKHKFLVVPSLWREPFGIVALEGLACGCIPIVSDGGGLPEAVGDFGLIFERGNTNELVSYMKLVRDHFPSKHTQAELASYLHKFQQNVVAEKYLQILNT